VIADKKSVIRREDLIEVMDWRLEIRRPVSAPDERLFAGKKLKRRPGERIIFTPQSPHELGPERLSR